MKMVIIGSGISGIMAARYFARYDPLIIERESHLSFLNNNYASIRFKNEEIGTLLNTRLKKISITKQIYWNRTLYNYAPIDAKNLYSLKVAGKLDKRSIDFDHEDNLRYIIDGDNLRYIIDGDMCPKMPYRYLVNSELIGIDRENNSLVIRDKRGITNVVYDICISTIPMPTMLHITKTDGIELSNFKMSPVYVTTVSLNILSKVYQTIYFPQNNLYTYRANLEENKVLIESLSDFPSDDEIDFILQMFGLDGNSIKRLEVTRKIQKSGKISSIDDTERKSIILHLTEEFSVYSLGRYAIWKNGVEMDDVYQDLKKIEKLIEIDNSKERKYEGRID